MTDTPIMALWMKLRCAWDELNRVDRLMVRGLARRDDQEACANAVELLEKEISETEPTCALDALILACILAPVVRDGFDGPDDQRVKFIAMMRGVVRQLAKNADADPIELGLGLYVGAVLGIPRAMSSPARAEVRAAS